MKEWKYRFKRGLASFLTVGMIASGVGVTTCMPVYAVEATDTATTPADELQNAVYAGLKQQILGLCNDDSREKAEFTVVFDFKNQGSKDSNTKLVDDVAGNAKKVLEELLKECSSEMFWYDQTSKKLNKTSYMCEGAYIGKPGKESEIITTTFKFQFAVKGAYRPVDSKEVTAISVQAIKDTKNAMGEDELNKVVEGIYSDLRGEIVKMFDEESTKNNADFQVIVECKNQEVVEALKKKMETSAPGIVSRLSSEYPSELFWYNQDSDELPGQCSNYYTVSPNANNGNQLYFTFFFAVKDEYRADLGVASSLNATTIKETKKKIDGLLDNTDMSAYEILCKYREELISDKSISKNQFPYVFEWLCNQTASFTSSGTKCYTVEGTIVKAGKKPVAHTWNIVAIGGKNYVVDLVNHAATRDGEFFLVGAQPQDGGYVIGNGTKYIPGEEAPNQLPSSVLKYKPEQTEFRFVTQPNGKVGDVLVLKVEGNKGKVRFVSDRPAYATIETKSELGDNAVLVHLNEMGATVAVAVKIQAISEETDAYAETVREYTMFISATNTGNGGNTGGNTGGNGGNTGGSGDGTGGGGIIGGGGTGGSVAGGGVVYTSGVAGPRDLLPQVDFHLNSGSATILKAVGAEDFTITASGQVKDSVITYASSDTSVATVDANTGTVHIVGPGSASISATASETTLHRAESCEYKLEVQ